MRIGLDVGGTHTDAVLMDGSQVIARVKVTTTEDVASGGDVLGSRYLYSGNNLTAIHQDSVGMSTANV